MKKYLLFCLIVVMGLLGLYYLTFYTSFHLFSHKTVTSFVHIQSKKFEVNDRDFQIHAINLGSSIPGHDDKEFSINKETYLRWFQLIQEMHINTIRVYTIESPTFYKAFKEYNN